MIFRKTVIVIVLIAVGSICSCARHPTDYLMYGPGVNSKELRWISKKIESGDWGQDFETIASNLKVGRDLAAEASLHGIAAIKTKDKLGISAYGQEGMLDLTDQLSDLLAYSNEEGMTKCNNFQVRAFVQVAGLRFGGIKKFEKSLAKPPNNLLFQYLQHYGTQHAKECMASLQERFDARVNKLSVEDEAKFDTLIAMGEQYTPEVAEARLTAQAESLDLAKGKFDAKKMLTVVEQYLPEAKGTGWLKPVESAKRLARFIRITCDRIRSILVFDMYNLAKILAPETAASLEMSSKFKKLNEYSRICIPFDDFYPFDNQARPNVIRNMFRQEINSAFNQNS